MIIIKIIHKIIIYTIFLIFIFIFIFIFINTNYSLNIILKAIYKNLSISSMSVSLTRGINLNGIIYKDRFKIESLSLNMKLTRHGQFSIKNIKITNLNLKEYKSNLNLLANLRLTDNSIYINIKHIYGSINGKEIAGKMLIQRTKEHIYINNCNVISTQSVLKSNNSFNKIKLTKLFNIENINNFKIYGTISDDKEKILIQNIQYEHIKVKTLIINKARTKILSLFTSYIQHDEFYTNKFNVSIDRNINIHAVKLNSSFQDLNVIMYGTLKNKCLTYVIKDIKNYDNYNLKTFRLKIYDHKIKMDNIFLTNEEKNKKIQVISKIKNNDSSVFFAVIYVYSFDLNVSQTSVLSRSYTQCNIYAKLKMCGKIGLMSVNIKSLIKFE